MDQLSKLSLEEAMSEEHTQDTIWNKALTGNCQLGTSDRHQV